MENDRDLRNVILLLVKAHKMYQARALSLNTALSAIMALPSTKRAEITDAQIHEEAQKVLSRANQLADEQSAPLEKALGGSSDFLETLRVYASQQFRKQ